MIAGIASKLLSESLLSLYPVFVKNINIPLFLKIVSRYIIYALISLFFIDFSFVYQNLFTYAGILLPFFTLLHVYTSYKGFEILESGVAYSLFYTYPLFILLLSGISFQWWMVPILMGVFLLSFQKKDAFSEKFSKEASSTKKSFFPSNLLKTNPNVKERFMYEGVVMILLASVTEAAIYFLVRKIKTKNHWNHMFLSYGWLALLFIFLYSSQILTLSSSIAPVFNISMAFNLVIGLFGYLLRFYAIHHLDTTLYSSLSYFGILMSYLYGMFFQGDVITPMKIIGTLLILIPNLWYLFS